MSLFGRNKPIALTGEVIARDQAYALHHGVPPVETAAEDFTYDNIRGSLKTSSPHAAESV
jgi:hypothetical protein